MLISISSSLDYRHFLMSQKSSLSVSDLKRLSNKCFSSAIHKLKKLDIDLVHDLLFSLYSPIGRPANDPAVIIRSFILMLHLRKTSVKNWCFEVQSDPLLQYIIGSWNVPNFASHYDFINRFTHAKPRLDEFFPKGKFSVDKSNKPKKGQKWENFSKDDSYNLTQKYSDNPSFDRNRWIFSLQSFFNSIAVIPSSDMGFIDSSNLICSGDGTAFHVHANPHGTKIDDDHYRYSAKNADFGYDSDLESFYFGHTLFNISTHNSLKHIDLPVFIALEKASRHDVLNSISASAQFFDMNSLLHPSFMCFDSACDSGPFYQFLRQHNTIPIIDINQRNSGDNPFKKFDNLSKNGLPICKAGVEMCNFGYDIQRHRRKFRCPLAVGKIKECPHKSECSSSSYGKTVYINDHDDVRLFGPVQFKSDKWKEIYKNRTCTERINNRILNDYKLHQMRIREDSKIAFFAIFAAINIHLDAWIK